MGSDKLDMNEDALGMTSRLGPLEIDWPRTIGYYGGVSLAVAFELVEPPLALFIAVIPFLKMLNYPGASRVTRFLGQLLEGAARPVGGSSESTLQLAAPPLPLVRRPSILREAREIVEQRRASLRHGS